MKKTLAVLVIEDDADLAKLYASMISLVPYARAEICAGINSGVEGLERIKGGQAHSCF